MAPTFADTTIMQHKSIPLIVGFVIFFHVVLASRSSVRGQTTPNGAESWPSFRGPNGNGVVYDARIPLSWSADENIAWHIKLPDRGNSTPIVSGDRIFVTQAIENENRRTLMCFEKATGKLLWQSGVTFDGKEPTNAQNPHCSSTPATDGERIVTFFGAAGLYCYDVYGKELWHRDFGTVDSWHGSGSSPIIHNGICFLNFGPGTQSALYACDVRTGETVWKKELQKQKSAFSLRELLRLRSESRGSSEPGDESDDKGTPFSDAGRSADLSGKGGFNGSWSSPIVIEVEGRNELVVVESQRVVGYEPKTGEEIWSCGGLPPQVFATPAIGDDTIVALGHLASNGTKIIAIKTGGKGEIDEAHKLWELTLKKECISSGIVHNGHLYLMLQNGIGTCLSMKTGEKKWEKRIRGKGANGGMWGSMILAGNALLVPNLSGEVFVIDAAPEFKLLGSNFIGDETMCATPVVTGKQLILRTYEGLWCIEANNEQR